MNEKTIWDFLLKKTGNVYGTAAIMGNLMAESSLNPANVTGTKDHDYIKNADAGTINFAHDGHAFGLAQWCYHTRKQGLLDIAKSRGTSVGDLNTQLEYLYQEMSQKYKTAWNAVTSATSIRTASDVVMLKYEKPAGTSDSAKAKRAAYGQKYFDQFAKGSQGQSQTDSCRKMVVARVNVNVRAGDATSFAKLGSLKTGDKAEWVATAVNGWHAIRYCGKVGWVSGEFTRTEG